ncbi:hypothetical protein KKC06_02445 [Patescibacteria group bacterium]|nr:hypothetical protein [Patescibacteria group bacterium]
MIEALIFITGILNLVLGFVILKKSKNIVQKNFSYVAILISIWNFVNFIYYLNPIYPYINLSYSFGAIVVTSILLWVGQYLKNKYITSSKILFFIITVILFVLPLLPDIIIINDFNSFVVGFDIKIGPWFLLFAIPISFELIWLSYLLFRSWKKESGLKKVQLSYVLLSFSIPAFFIVVFDFVLPFFGNSYLASFDTLTTLIFVSMIAYSILRYRFFDIKVVIRKGIIHFTSLAIILFLYIYLLIFSQKLFIEKYNWSEQTTTIILVLLIVITIEPLRRALIRVVDKVFYSKQKDVEEEASELKSIMSSSLQLDQLLKKIVTEFKAYLAVSDIQFIWHNKQTGNLENYYKNERRISFSSNNPLFQYLQNNSKLLVTEEIPYLIEEKENGEVQLLKEIEYELKQLKVGLVLPIGERGEIIGLLLFNKKENNEAFTADDIHYLSRMQSQMTGAIANALLYKQAVERISVIR